MDVKNVFLNVDLNEDVYMQQPEGFVTNGNEHWVCKLRKYIYGLKQVSRQWYLKFDEVGTSLGFEENKVDQCIYLKVSRSNSSFLCCILMIFCLPVVILVYFMRSNLC